MQREALLFDEALAPRYNRSILRGDRKMKKAPLPRGLIIVALFQWVPPLLLPPQTLRTINPIIWGVVAALFALLGVSLLRRQAWSRLASIFLQGFNIIVRVLVTLSHAVVGGKPGGPVDYWFVGTTVVSIILSAVVLLYIDRPDIQVAMA